MKSRASLVLRSLVLLTLLAVVPTSPHAAHSEIYAGTWGPADAGQGRVYHYLGGTSWQDLSPAGGLADAVWDLEWIAGELWAATHFGPPSERDDQVPHGTSGRIYRHDGTEWIDASPPGGFESAVTTVTTIRGQVYITVDTLGLLRWEGGNSWALVAGDFRLAAQAIVSDSHDGRPLLYIGQDNTDEFWIHDPDGILPCGVRPPGGPPQPDCQVPSGDACSADCFFGSCIHAMTEFDDGGGPLVYAGAWFGQMYRWSPSSRTFVEADDVPGVIYPPGNPDLEHVDGLASYQGRLWVGMSDGTLWSSPDARASTYQLDEDFGVENPVSEMIAVPQDDELWIGFGGVPWRWARRTGLAMVRTLDAEGVRDRSLPGQFGQGVLVLLAVTPEIRCDAGPAQEVECAGGPVAVTLDGSGTTVSEGFPATYEWTGPFLEGTASGETVTVHFEGAGDHDVTLTVTAGRVTESCETLVSVVDRTPPAAVGAPACTWPPNHRYRCFTAAELLEGGSASAHDDCDGEVGVGIVDVASSQPEDALGDGATLDDALFDRDAVCVRSERLGGDPAGRDYTVVLEARDAAGNVSLIAASIHVPHDQRRDRRCASYSGGVGLLPHAELPLSPDRREGRYPAP